MPSRSAATTSPKDAVRLLARLTRSMAAFGPGCAAPKLALIKALARAELPSASAVLRFHDALSFLRAYPDDARVLALVERVLAGFERRADLVRFRAELDDSGIAGTDIYYTFFADTARWLAQRFPERLTIAWDYLADETRLAERLNLFATPPELLAIDDYDLGLRGWLERLKGPKETDAAYLLERWWRLPMDATTRQSLYEEMQLLLKLAWGRGGPSRTAAKLKGSPPTFQTEPLDHRRPDLLRAAETPPIRVRAVSAQEGGRLVAMAREAMITRSRDLDVFCYGDARDVRVLDFERGLSFVAIGMIPERRLLLESVYGLLTLKNGVPIGYVLTAGINESAEMAYNVFDTWRGHEAANIYAKALAAASFLLGAKAFTVPPYQLGHDNEEGLASGAWWFYQKLGFRPRDRATTRLMNRELTRIRSRRGYRSSTATLQDLSSEPLYLEGGAPRPDITGVFELSAASLAVTDMLAKRFGSDRERGALVTSEEVARTLSVPEWKRWPQGERLAFQRWAPLVSVLPGVARWTRAERRALVDVIRKKGGRYESDYAHAYNAHRRLREALVRLVRAAAKKA